MIKVQEITIDEKRYKRTFSDKYYIVRDGVMYEDAVDPIDSGREYTESDVLLPELTAEEALEIIVGGIA